MSNLNSTSNYDTIIDVIQFKGGNAILINAVRLDPTATNNIEQV